MSWPMLAGAGIGLLAAAVVATPAGLRVLQRRRRLAAGSAGILWDELAATALDTGVRLHPAWTPRRAARELTGLMARTGGTTDPAAADAVQRLTRAEEAACYGRPGERVPHPDLAAALRTARRALLRSASRRVRVRALLWPASLVAGTGTRTAGRARRRLAAVGHLLRRPRPV
jgi:hypothetical protein